MNILNNATVATKALMERRDVVIIASVSAIYGLGDPRILYEDVVASQSWRHRGQLSFCADLPNYSTNVMI